MTASPGKTLCRTPADVARSLVATQIVLFRVSKLGLLEVGVTELNGADERSGGLGLQKYALPCSFLDDGGYGCSSIPSDVLSHLGLECASDSRRSGERESYIDIVDVYRRTSRASKQAAESEICVAYLVVVNCDDVCEECQIKWVALEDIEECVGGRDWEVVQMARRKLAEGLGFGRKDEIRGDVLFALLPNEFTLGDAQIVVQALRGEPVDKSNFRKYMEKLVERTGKKVAKKTRPAALYRRQQADHPEGNRKNIQRLPLSADHIDACRAAQSAFAEIRNIANLNKIRNMDLLLGIMKTAPAEAIDLLEMVVSSFGNHQDYVLRVTRSPDIRVEDIRTERVLLTMKWQSQKESFLCTALAAPEALNTLGLPELGDCASGPHKAKFRLKASPKHVDASDSAERLESVLLLSARSLMY